MIPDQESRDTARRALDRNVVVEAGAGTGKTTLLTDRLLFLLLGGGRKGEGIDVRRLVALTFTEKAAGEIKVRLAARLNDLVAAVDGRALPEDRARPAAALLEEARVHFGRAPAQVRAAAEAALHGMDAAPIGTIHHFAALLLRLYPLESGVDPSFEVDTGPAFHDLFESEWALWLDRELGEAPPRPEAWLEVLEWVPLEDLEDLARALCREPAAEARPGLSPRMREELCRLAGELARLPDGKPSPGRSTILPSIAAVTERLRLLADCPARPALSPEPARDLKKDKEKTWPRSWQALEGEDLYRRGAALAAGTSPFAEGLVRRAADLLAPFAEAFRRRYAQKGYIGFDGLLVRARALLRDDLGVRRQLKARFDAVLVDEFQDTDPVQGELLLYLAEEPGSQARRWEGVRFAPGKIFVVGDPKQSIYRFRGADIRAYDRFTRLILEQGGALCPLQTNFRSHRGLVDPVNAVFSVLMREEPGLQPAYRPIHPRPDGPPDGLQRGEPEALNEPGEAPAVEYALVEEDGEDGLRARAAQAREARWIVRWIRENCAAPGAPADGRFRLRDVALLFRTGSPLAIYLEAFKEAGIPYAVESDRAFYAAQETVDFVNLLRALDDPADSVSLVGLLRSPLAGLEDREIYSLSLAEGLSYLQDPPAGAALSPDSRRRLAALYGFLRGFHGRVGREPLGDLIARLLRDSFLLETCSAAYQREQTLSNLMKFGRLAAEAGESRGATLKEFIRGVLRSMEETAEEGESPLADESLEAVRVLTIHKSKGLEFAVVFLPNLGAPVAGARDQKPCWRADWEEGAAGMRLPRTKAADIALAMIEQAESRREELERTRLLYVAMTRAREKMFLLGRAGVGPRSSLSWHLARAGAWPAGGEKPAAIALGGLSLPVAYIGNVSVAPPLAPPPRRVLDPEPLARVWDRRREKAEAARGAVIFRHPTAAGMPESASPPPSDRDVVDSLAAGGDVVAARALGPQPQAGAERREEAAGKSDPFAGEPVPAGAPAVLIGRICHRVLELWDFRRPAGLAEAAARAARSLRSAEPDGDWDAAQGEALAVLRTFLASPAAERLSRCELLAREAPFLFPWEGGVMRGSVDLLCREDGRLWVADYKTDRVTPGEAALAAERYRAQGAAYIRAVEKSLGEPCGFRVIFLRSGECLEVIPQS